MANREQGNKKNDKLADMCVGCFCCAMGGLAHYVIAAAAVASHNVKHAWVLAWVASRFAASSCHLRFSHFAIVLLFS